MITSIKIFLDSSTELNLAEKKVYKKPIWENQPDNYIYFLSNSKIRIKTGYRQRFSFYIVAEDMVTIETLSANLEILLVWNGYAINSSLWKIVQQSEIDFPDEMIRVIDYNFYSTFN